jgi:hypothetical protein
LERTEKEVKAKLTKLQKGQKRVQSHRKRKLKGEVVRQEQRGRPCKGGQTREQIVATILDTIQALTGGEGAAHRRRQNDTIHYNGRWKDVVSLFNQSVSPER